MVDQRLIDQAAWRCSALLTRLSNAVNILLLLTALFMLLEITLLHFGKCGASVKDEAFVTGVSHLSGAGNHRFSSARLDVRFAV